MRRRGQTQPEEPEPEQPQPQADDRDGWDSPEFLRSRLINLAFVLAPAIIMLALGESKIAAAWAAVGMLIILFDSRRQLRDFWWALRSG